MASPLLPPPHRLSALLQAEAAGLSASILTSMMDTCPQQALRALAGALHALLICPTLAPSAPGWMGLAVAAVETARVQQQQQSGGGGERVGGDEGGLRRFLALAVGRQPALPRGRFEALVADMAAIGRGEESGDALLGYEM